MYFDCVGNPVSLSVSPDEHPLFPYVMLYVGCNAVIEYEPDTTALEYSRHNVRAGIAELVRAYI